MAAPKDNPGVLAPPPLLYAGAFGVVLGLRRLWPLPILDGDAAGWPGLVLLTLGLGLAVWGARTLRRAGTNVNPMLPTKAIVTSGPYRFTRNPLYCALTLVFCGLTLAVNSWWGAVLLVPLLGLMHGGVVLREERYLEKKFDGPYREYCSRVRRYL